MNILVIDDEYDLREVIRESLELDGHAVTEAANGTIGLKAIQANPPDLIISDVRMPGMGGDELFNILRTKETGLHLIPFIFLTAHTSDNEIVKRLNDGASHCLRKPASMKLLRALANSCQSNQENLNQFITKRLDDIADVLPHSINQNFGQFNSLVANLDAYASSIASLLRTYVPLFENEGLDALMNVDRSDIVSDNQRGCQKQRLKIVQLYLKELDSRQQLIEKTGTLTWHLIYLVAESDLLEKNLFVSDLYVAANAAKSTVNNHINALIDDGIFEKHGVINDGRRQRILLSKSFSDNVYVHIDEFSRLAATHFNGQNQSTN